MVPPIPVAFDPIFKPKPWGGDMLATLFGKRLPPGQLIGESWELVSMAGEQSRVRDGPLVGRTIPDLVDTWGNDLLGREGMRGGRFPWLVKLLDARQPLSIQVHPHQSAGGADSLAARVKHEAWYVLAADPGAELMLGLEPGVTREELARAAGTSAIRELLRRWPARPGQLFHLPAGIVHALGGGLVVAEIQTPSDATYRLYDWQRCDARSWPRPLHIAQALENIAWNAAPQVVQSPHWHDATDPSSYCPAITCASFALGLLRLPPQRKLDVPVPGMVVWIITAGGGAFVRDHFQTAFHAGDTLLVPANRTGLRVQADASCDAIVVGPPHPL